MNPKLKAAVVLTACYATCRWGGDLVNAIVKKEIRVGGIPVPGGSRAFVLSDEQLGKWGDICDLADEAAAYLAEIEASGPNATWWKRYLSLSKRWYVCCDECGWMSVTPDIIEHINDGECTAIDEVNAPFGQELVP